MVRLVAAAVLWVAALVGGWYWVSQVERGEVLLESDLVTLAEHAKGPQATRVSARLLQFELGKGERATFELCFVEPPGDGALEQAFDVAVFGLEPMRLLLRVPLDAAHVALLRRGDAAACLPLGGGLIEEGGTHSVDLVWPNKPPPESVLETQIWVRGLVRRDLPAQSWFVVAALGAIVLAVFAFGRRKRESTYETLQDRAAASVVVGLALLVLIYLLLQIPTNGSVLGYFKGVAIAGVQVLLVWVAMRWVEKTPRPFEQLALHGPTRLWFAVPLALFSGVALSVIARAALGLVPSTGVAPIQTFIAWPSGTLALALVGAIAPFAEELFFRGYLYAIFKRWGEVPSLLLTTAAFTVFHLAQSWGNWGGVVAISLAGVGFGMARYWSGSVWVAALTHTAYNLALSFSSFFGFGLW